MHLLPDKKEKAAKYQWVPAKSQFGTKFQIFKVKIHVPKFGIRILSSKIWN